MLAMAQIQYIKHLQDKKDKGIVEISALVCQILASAQVAVNLIAPMPLSIQEMTNAENLGQPIREHQAIRYFVW